MKNSKQDLENGPIFKTFIKYAVPSVLGMLMLSIAGIVDGLFIGRYVGTEALAAVSIVYPIFSLAIGFVIMIGIGGTTTAAAELGAKNIKAARNTFTVTTILVTGTALMFMFVGIFFAKPISLFFGKKGGLDEEILTYFVTLILFMVPFMHLWILDVFIRNDGRPMFPTVVLIFSSLSNILLDYLFVAKLQWGLRGAALATGLSQLCPSLILWGFIFKNKTTFKFVKPVFKLKRISRMLFNGASEFINEFSVGISTIMFNMALLTRIGSIAVASYSIIQYVTMITMMIFFGIAQASQPGLSYNLGVGNLKRIRSFKKAALYSNIVVALIAFLILLFLNKTVASLFTKGDADVINLTTQIAQYYSWAYLPMALNITFSMYFTCIHYAKESAITAILRSLVLFIFFLYILPIFFGNIGLWLTVPASEFITLIIVLILLKKRPLNQDYLNRTIEELKA